MRQSYSNNPIENFFKSIGDAARTNIYTGQERDQSSLQPPLNEALPPVRQATVPNGVQTATATAPVDPVGTTGIASLGGTSRIDVDKARKLFPNDITFAARGGAISSGIGAFR